jgi:hypothetical protein
MATKNVLFILLVFADFLVVEALPEKIQDRHHESYFRIRVENI